MGGKDSKRSIRLRAKSLLDLGPLEHLCLHPMQLRTHWTKSRLSCIPREGGASRTASQYISCGRIMMICGKMVMMMMAAIIAKRNGIVPLKIDSSLIFPTTLCATP